MMFATLSLGKLAHADIGATHTSLVSEFASFNTPAVLDGRVEAIAVDGDKVFVGGSFTRIQDPMGGKIYERAYLFAYSKSSGNIISSFDPVLDNRVFALETTGDGNGVFVGGIFGRLNGEGNRRGLVKIDDNGDRVYGFSARPNALVASMVRLENKLYIGGNFTSITHTPVEFLAAVDTTTGVLDTTLSLDFDGVLQARDFPSVSGVEDIDITTDGKLLVVAGNFRSINGLPRPRLAVIENDGQARVSNWDTDVYHTDCRNRNIPQYIRAVDIAPDNSYFVVGTQGAYVAGDAACDTIVRFELDDLTNADMQPTWVNFTGGDSVFEVVSTEHALYVGGHFRWLNNDTTDDGNSAGAGSVPRAGLGALDPKNGLALVDWRSDRNPRGVGIFALIAEEEGLYIGDDTDFLNGSVHPKLKFLPITTEVIERPAVQQLPATLLTTDADSLAGSRFDGTDFGASEQLLAGEWVDARGAMFVGGNLFHADDNGSLWMSRYNGESFDTREAVEVFGLSENEWPLSQITGMYFSHDNGRVYYTLQDDTRLFWRAFTPAGPYFGNDVHVVEQQSDIAWADISGMDAIGGHLFFALTDGNLYRTDLENGEPVSGTTEIISGPGIDDRSWNNDLLAFIAEDVSLKAITTADAEFEFEFSGSDAVRSFRAFEFPVETGEQLVLRLSWIDASAQLDLRVRDANGVLVATNTRPAGSPKWLSMTAGEGGTYTATVQINKGSTAYTLQVNPAEQAPAARADFEFFSSGTANAGRFQVFNFDVTAGDLVEAAVNWSDADADVRVFLRDENTVRVAYELDGSGSALLSVVAQSSGQWSIAVMVNSETTVNYDVLVDTSDFVMPEPLADFEFSSSGSNDDRRFQIFDIDVTAGELVEVSVDWNVPNADVRVFLRNQNRTQVDRDTQGVGTGTVSAMAQTGGRWSVAVLVNSDVEISYQVLVDTTPIVAAN